jgi:hypothetical protein
MTDRFRDMKIDRPSVFAGKFYAFNPGLVFYGESLNSGVAFSDSHKALIQPSF